MRYITIPESAYKACKEMGEYSGPKTLMCLAQSAFDGNLEVGDVDKENRAVFVALRDEIDESLIDDDDRMIPCEPPTGIASIKVLPVKADHDVIDHLAECLKEAFEDALEDDDD